MKNANAVIHYAGNDFFVAVPPSGHAITLDINGERSAAPGPLELLLVALGGCTAADVISVLHKKRERCDRLSDRSPRRAPRRTSPQLPQNGSAPHSARPRAIGRQCREGDRAIDEQILQRGGNFAPHSGDRDELRDPRGNRGRGSSDLTSSRGAGAHAGKPVSRPASIDIQSRPARKPTSAASRNTRPRNRAHLYSGPEWSPCGPRTASRHPISQ